MKARTIESWSMINGKAGFIFYSDKKDRHLTAIATHYKRKIKTERLTTLTREELPTVGNIVKVTIIN